MNKLLLAARVWLRFEDRNEKTYWIGLLMLFVGLAWAASLFIALIVVGAAMAGESVLTSYLAALLNSRNQ